MTGLWGPVSITPSGSTGPGRSDEWALHDFRGIGLSNARGLSIGQVFDRQGVHMATVAQEILMRKRTPDFEGKGK